MGGTKFYPDTVESVGFYADVTTELEHEIMAQIREIVATQAAKRGMVVVDGLTLVPHQTEFYADAFLHPNDLGFAPYTLNLLKAIRQYI